MDAEATLSQLDLATVNQIERLAPFGMGNPRPVFCATRVDLAETPKPLGNSGRHLSAQLSQHGKRLRAVAFGHAEEWLPELEQINAPVDLAFRPVINEYRGFRKVELHLVDWRRHQVDVPAQDPVAGAPAATENASREIPAPHFNSPVMASSPKIAGSRPGADD